MILNRITGSMTDSDSVDEGSIPSWGAKKFNFFLAQKSFLVYN